MIIPKLHYISKEESSKEQLENIQKACSSGIELVRLVLKKNVSEKKSLKLANEVKEITAHFQTRLLITDNYKIAKEIKADGVHLSKISSCPTVVRKHIYTWQMIGATANTLQDCETLIDKQVDYISLSSFKAPENTDNSTKVLGLKGYTAISDVLKTATPLIGTGNITLNDVEDIIQTGISGIAAFTAIKHDFNSIKLFNQLLKASVTDEQRYTFK